jgi:thymidylate synthase
MTFEYHLLNLYHDILSNGEHREDRTGTGTISVFGRQLRINLQEGFPILTTKKMGFKSIFAELLWFIEGSSDERRLAEILYGTRDESKQTIWSGNANADYWKSNALYEGDLGRVYGVQWRYWQKPDGSGEIDQLSQIISKIKTDPTNRRMILSAWNVGELHMMALPPCHMMAQFYVSKGKLSCQMYQRSVDSFLGLPYNISSYAMLVHMIAHVTDLDVGELIMTFGDTHIYSNHVEQVKEQIARTTLELPSLKFNRKISSIDDFKLDDCVLVGYNSHPSIKAEMAV